MFHIFHKWQLIIEKDLYSEEYESGNIFSLTMFIGKLKIYKCERCGKIRVIIKD